MPSNVRTRSGMNSFFHPPFFYSFPVKQEIRLQTYEYITYTLYLLYKCMNSICSNRSNFISVHIDKLLGKFLSRQHFPTKAEDRRIGSTSWKRNVFKWSKSTLSQILSVLLSVLFMQPSIPHVLLFCFYRMWKKMSRLTKFCSVMVWFA